MSTRTRIRVAVVDDHQMFAESLVRILGVHKDVEVVGVAGSGEEARALVASTDPDVVILDYMLPDASGTDVAYALRTAGTRARILMLTGLGDEKLLVAAIEAGCAGFLTKDKTVEELVAAVRDVHRGEIHVPQDLLAHLLPGLSRTEHGLGAALTAREREVLDLLATGITNAGLAQKLSVSVNTVRNHVQSILTKLGAHSKLEAVAIAVRERIIDIPR